MGDKLYLGAKVDFYVLSTFVFRFGRNSVLDFCRSCGSSARFVKFGAEKAVLLRRACMKILGLKERLGKFSAQRRSVRPLAISRDLYEGNVVVESS